MNTYTKFTHAVAGIVTILSGFYAVSQQFRDWVAALAVLYAAHVPTILQPIPPLALALYMWYRNGGTDPNQPKSAPPAVTSVLTLTSVLSIALVLMTFLTTGCNYSQADVVNAVQTIEAGLKTAQALLPQGNVILQELEQVDPGAIAEYGPFISNAQTLVGKAITASDAYLANPGADAYQALLNAVDAITAQADQQLLASLKIVNPNSQIKVTGWIALFSTGLHVALTVAESYATSKQKKAVPAVTARVPFNQVRPFLNRSYAREELTSMGYKNPDQLLAYAGL
jgi:hypothetical protein